ncbi:MAG: hypothetical protein ACJA01_000755 [Saprospiraceae bacterium]|jgi:hypothetical protein
MILPIVVNNNYRGQKIALWFFYLITAVTVVRSCIHMFKSDGGAQSIGAIPLDTYSDGAAGVVIGIFAYWGLSQLMFGIMQVIVALKYKSLIPLMYLMLILEWAGRFVLGMYKPIETVGQAPGGIGNMVLPFVCLIMFFLSIKKQ